MVVSPGKWDRPDRHDADRDGVWEGSSDRQAGGPDDIFGDEALAVLLLDPLGPGPVFGQVVEGRLGVQPLDVGGIRIGA
jgi:hypothetical protein